MAVLAAADALDDRHDCVLIDQILKTIRWVLNGQVSTFARFFLRRKTQIPHVAIHEILQLCLALSNRGTVVSAAALVVINTPIGTELVAVVVMDTRFPSLRRRIKRQMQVKNRCYP